MLEVETLLENVLVHVGNQKFVNALMFYFV